MSLVTPKTNFLDLLEDMLEFIEDYYDDDPKEHSLYNRVIVAFNELEDIE